MICVFIIWREHPKAHRKWFYVGFFMENLQKLGKSQGIFLNHAYFKPLKMNKQIWNDDFNSFKVNIIWSLVMLMLYFFLLAILIC